MHIEIKYDTPYIYNIIIPHSPLFTSELVACILANCADQISTSETLAQQFCNVATLSPSLSFPSVPITTTTSTSTSDTSTAPPTTSASTSPTSAAVSAIVHTGRETMLGLLVTTLGLVFGAYVLQ
ncbi:hypothetical protein BDN70DRAFT_939550 [Pholiota conissans]|uniref:Uncharacterized protein n=1 Tax=Pholiota conissans TaxID=109636 RepID=A0A9P5YL75_9AGAR|nr:hypothetical protein BDN70DRAFT_939550 [Pholiota conissans]